MQRSVGSPQSLQRSLEELDKPRSYVKILTSLFRMKDSFGRPFDYMPQPYQVKWHERFYLVDPEAPHRLWNKGRGVGATAITMMDLIMFGLTYDGLNIPISSITGEQGDVPIQWAIWLVDNCKISNAINRDITVNTELRLTDTGSTIFKIPGKNPNKFRSYRCPIIYNDEFDWCDNQQTIIDASDNCMSEGGQRTIVSTIKNSAGLFNRFLMNAETFGYEVLRTPIFDEKALDPSSPLQEQVDSGRITPIAYWINIGNLETQRKKDLDIFMRENQCKAPDEEVNFMSWPLIQSACVIKRWSPTNPSGWLGDHRKKYTQLRRIGNNPYTLGIDYARFKDLSAFEVLEHSEFGIIQRYEHLLRGSDTQTQASLLQLLDHNFGFTNIRIDLTGAGVGLYDLAFENHGSKVEGIHFKQSMEIGDAKVPARVYYALNLRQQATDVKLKLFDYLELKEDLHSVPYDMSEAKRNQDGSHGDRFWALALGVAPAFDSAPWAFYV